MQWVRTNKSQVPYMERNNPEAKAYRLYSKWHLFHSLRVSESRDWRTGAMLPYTFALTYDGYQLDAEGAEIKENPVGTICDSCHNFNRRLRDSVEVEYVPKNA